jgi:hypothetical protein
VLRTVTVWVGLLSGSLAVKLKLIGEPVRPNTSAGGGLLNTGDWFAAVPTDTKTIASVVPP